MNRKKLKLYSILSQLPFLRNSYTFKIIIIVFMGCLIPLLTLIVYLTVSSSLSIDGNLNFLVVVLIATLVGMVSILLLLYWLLYPITLTSTTLHKYLNEEENPSLPAGFQDTVGQLMTDVQYTVEKLNLLNQSLKSSPAIDPLTGILNRSASKKRLRQEMARTRRENKQMLIALFKIEQFKKINEQFGYRIGDTCLIQVVDILSKSIREGDWLARWKEDEFLVVLWDFHDISPIKVLKRIQQPIKIPIEKPLQITLSIGASEYKGNINVDIKIELERLIILLEEALSEVKQNGINIVSVNG